MMNKFASIMTNSASFDPRNVSDERIDPAAAPMTLNASSSGGSDGRVGGDNSDIETSQSIEIVKQHGQDSLAVLVEPSFDADDQFKDRRGFKSHHSMKQSRAEYNDDDVGRSSLTRGTTLLDRQARSPLLDGEVDRNLETEARVSPAKEDRIAAAASSATAPAKHRRARHRRDLSEHFEDAAKISEDASPGPKFGVFQQYGGRGEPRVFDAGDDASVMKEDTTQTKHRRVFSNDSLNPPMAHRRINSIGESAAIKRSTYGGGRKRHQRVGSGLDVLSAAVAASAHGDIATLSAPGNDSKKDAARREHGAHGDYYSRLPSDTRAPVPPAASSHGYPASAGSAPSRHDRFLQYPHSFGTPTHSAYAPPPTAQPPAASNYYDAQAGHHHPYYQHPLHGASHAPANQYHPQYHYQPPSHSQPQPRGRHLPTHPHGHGHSHQAAYPYPGGMSYPSQHSGRRSSDTERPRSSSTVNPEHPPPVTASGEHMPYADGQGRSHQPPLSGYAAAAAPTHSHFTALSGEAEGPAASSGAENRGGAHHRNLSSFSSLGPLPNIFQIPEAGEQQAQQSSKKSHHRITSSTVSFLKGFDIGFDEDVVFLKGSTPPAAEGAAATATQSDQLTNAGFPTTYESEQTSTLPSPPPRSTAHNFSAPTESNPVAPTTKLAQGGTSKRVRRKCTKEGCTNRVVQGGLCISHGAKRKTCKHPGCAKHVKKAGYCSTHGPPRKQCEAKGCTKVAVQGGRCIAHGAKKKLCCMEYCTKQAILTGMCKKHHDQVAAGLISHPESTASRLPPPSTVGLDSCHPVAASAGKPDQDSAQMSAHVDKKGHKRGISIFQEISTDTVRDLLHPEIGTQDAQRSWL